MKTILNRHPTSLWTRSATLRSSCAQKPAVPLDLSYGFTLIELMTTLSIAMILMTLAVPNFSTIVSNNTLTAQANDLNATLGVARSQAHSRRRTVVVCKSDDQASCSTSQEVNWEDGWIAFVDGNDTRTKQDTELMLRTSAGLSRNNSLRPDAAFASYIAFQADGRSIGSGSQQPPAQGDFVLCDARGTDHSRTIHISPIGRAKVDPTPGANACP